jgi:hypothetical protein
MANATDDAGSPQRPPARPRGPVFNIFGRNPAATTKTPVKRRWPLGWSADLTAQVVGVVEHVLNEMSLSRAAEVTENILVKELWYNKITPVQAEQIAEDRGLPPLESQPNPADYIARLMREPRWTRLMVVAWVAYGSLAEVIKVWDEYRCQCRYLHYSEKISEPDGGVHEGYILEHRKPATLQDMVYSDIARHADGTLPPGAIGIRDADEKLVSAASDWCQGWHKRTSPHS